MKSSGHPDTPISTILNDIAVAGYDVWVVGGAVRDLLPDDGDPERVNDFDLAGTVPHQLFYTQFLKRHRGRHELDLRVSKNGVLWLLPADSGRASKTIEPIFQYATLKCSVNHEARDVHWFDHDLEDDLRWRDVTMNSLFFDPAHSLVLDPSGEGCRDVLNMRLNPIQLTLAWKPQIATALFRILKMAYKYRTRHIELAPAREFIAANLLAARQEFLEQEESGQRQLIQKFYGNEANMLSDASLSLLSAAGELVGLTDDPQWGEILARVRLIVATLH